MHRIELFEHATRLAERMGYGVRHEWLGGGGGGGCEIAGKKWIFIDLAQSSVEQMQQVLDVLREDAAVYTMPMAPELADELGVRRCA
ncbi:MAG: hypothetical protein R3E01_24180 [Pirellulaceae bacterium]|nr:hypothetical protein [Planctomycetales bacterium]